MANVLIIDDDAALREGLAETLSDLGHVARAVASGREGLAALTGDVDVVLLDLRMPGGLDGIEVLRRIRSQDGAPPVVILTAFASSDNTIEAMRIGAFDHLTKPIGRQELKQLMARLPARATIAGAPQGKADTLIGSSDGIRRVQKAIGLVADGAATVLILGETGTGKELVARAIHVHGQRGKHPFVAVNCAAIPAELLESELFGHVKGSFTGAAGDRAGAFVEAANGTLFLDEIGDMPLAMQAKILRALQERVVTPVGGKPIQIHARIIAATHRDLPELVTAKAFRQDLYYRLNVIPIVVPPLRERMADIAPLAEHFLALCCAGGRTKQLGAQGLDKLSRHGWPGNVRELRNVIERAYVLTRGDLIGPDDLDTSGSETSLPGIAAISDTDLPAAIAQLEEAMIRRALEASSGNRAEAARRLSINRQLLYAKMQRYGLGAEASEEPTAPVRKDDA